jgi:hypothetical protein
MGRRTHYTHILLDRGNFVLHGSAAKTNMGLLASVLFTVCGLHCLPFREVGTGRGFGIYCRICFAHALRDAGV